MYNKNMFDKNIEAEICEMLRINIWLGIIDNIWEFVRR